jgi:hypothetical protein
VHPFLERGKINGSPLIVCDFRAVSIIMQPCSKESTWHSELRIGAMSLLRRIWLEQDGGLSFEWAMFFTVVVIGIISGLTAARDAIIDELGDSAQAILALDSSFSISSPLRIQVDGQDVGGGSDSSFVDAMAFLDCARTFVNGGVEGGAEGGGGGGGNGGGNGNNGIGNGEDPQPPGQPPINDGPGTGPGNPGGGS